jgi:hypothetical protein
MMQRQYRILLIGLWVMLVLLVFQFACSYRAVPLSEPIKPHAVATEGVRAVRQDDATFRRRWDAVHVLPPAIEVRYSHDVNVSRGTERHAELADTVARSAPQPWPRHRLNTQPAGMSLCIRHKMRTVYTRNGRSWRCKK